MHVRLINDFKENIKAEFKDNIKRLRHHASLGILCGNNEMETAVMNYKDEGNELVKKDYLDLFEKILPDICNELAPDIFYWPASPSSSGGFDHPEDPLRGDSHFWNVWHGGAPFTDYRNHNFRFCSYNLHCRFIC